MEAPEKIYLQICGDCNDNNCKNCEFEDEPVEVEVTLETHCKEEAYNEIFSCLDSLEAKNVDLYRKIDKLIKK